jgi:ABC-2 type transport system permease protein
MRNILSIGWREFKAYYTSPNGFVVMGAWLLFAGVIFCLVVTHPQAVATMDPIFRNCTILLVIFLPLLTMRLLAGERGGDQGIGTIELLLTSPVSEWALVLGKYFAALLYLCTLVLASTIYAFTLLKIGKPDVGPIFGGYVGFFLFSGYVLAFGLLMSALTNSQIVAAVLAIVGCLVMWLVSFLDSSMGKWAEWLSWLSMLSHHEDFWRGVVTLVDVTWYVSFIFLFLFAAKQVIASNRWR